uniref:endonuclease/exonuclease/phosphatase family protein n=1 Tax=Thaumasiovibrio occultus TaxID=1891184 RepID=UPI000B34E061|nr:endonuclease/exonuclease/phosphatase family protein [Thaumasiovibrio occultus]
MSFDHSDGLENALAQPSERFSSLAATLQHVRPDIVLLCEFDHQGDAQATARVQQFQRHFLAHSQHGQTPIHYPYHCALPSNTGVTLGGALTGEGEAKLPEDGAGFGRYPGHFNFVVLTRFPIEHEQVQSWQKLRWCDFPRTQIPANYYASHIAKKLPLSSKNHLLVPVNVNGSMLNLLCCHPTPPVFDGEERRNLRRNGDELRLLKHIIEGNSQLRDDSGRSSALTPESRFVVLGDLNNDAFDGDGDKTAMRDLLYHPRIHKECAVGKLCPRSRGAFYQGLKLQRRGVVRQGKSAFWTHLNGLRLDYVLPSATLGVSDSGVFWPDKKQQPYRSWLENQEGKELPVAYSDHRLVWVDVQMGAVDR